MGTHHHRRARQRLRAALVVLAVVMLAACTRTDSGIGTVAPASTPSPGETVPAPVPGGEATDPAEDGAAPEGGGGGSDAAGLPKSARYGDITFTVEDARVTDTAPEGLTDDPEVESYAVLDVTAAGVVEEFTWNIPQSGILHLVVGEEDIDPVSTESFALESTESVTQTVVFPVPAETEIGAATLVVQEGRNDPDERRIPAEIPLGAGAPTPEADPVALQASPTRIEIHPIGDTAFNTIVSADLVENIGIRDNGAAWPGNVGLRRAPEGQVFLRLHLRGTSVDDSGVGCTGPVSGGVYTEGGEPSIDGSVVGDETASGQYCEGSPPAERYVVFEVPAERDSYEISFTNNDSSIAGTMVLSR